MMFDKMPVSQRYADHAHGLLRAARHAAGHAFRQTPDILAIFSMEDTFKPRRRDVDKNRFR